MEAQGAEEEAYAPRPTMFRITPEQWRTHRDLDKEFGWLVEHVNPVNHGEFETAVEKAMQQAKLSDASGFVRPAALVLQRCRRGGKTFMLHAIAKRLSNLRDSETHVIFITFNSDSRYEIGKENAYQAILGRIAYEYTGSCLSMDYDRFKRRYDDFGMVADWVRQNKVILLVDELNTIPPDSEDYWEMSNFLDQLVGRKGSSLIYSTHLRETSDLLRGRLAGGSKMLSLRDHEWLMIPRLVNENCLRGLQNDPVSQPSFWCAVLRGRLPALLVQPQRVVTKYGAGIFPQQSSDQDRMAAVTAVITGDILQLPKERMLFRAYSYMSERFTSCDTNKSPRFAWPPFLISQFDVLGKDCSSLRTSLEDPSIEEAKAFEALTQLAVLVRLLSAQHHELVPHNSNISDGGSFKATEILHVASSATTIAGIIDAVKVEFSKRPHVLQVVAVPYFASFPTYDFFVLHRADDAGWKVAAGYQCKQGTEHPTEEASLDVPLSVWIEGKCRKYRVREDGAHVPRTIRHGWVLLGESDQVGMLGVSVSEALPLQSPADGLPVGHRCCSAEMVWAEKNAAESSQDTSGASDDSTQEQPGTKRARIE